MESEAPSSYQRPDQFEVGWERNLAPINPADRKKIMSRPLVAAGVVFVILGLLLIAWAKLGLPNFAKLPGDIVYRGKNITFHFPIVTCLLISILLTLLLSLVRRS